MLIVIGIAFNLIIIRVDQGTAVGGTYNEPTLTTSPNPMIEHLTTSSPQESRAPDNAFCTPDSSNVIAIAV